MVDTAREWLEDLGLGRYADMFEDNDLDLELVTDLSDDDLEKLGIASMGHRKKLLRAIASMAIDSPDGDAVGAPNDRSAPPQTALQPSATVNPQGERRRHWRFDCLRRGRRIGWSVGRRTRVLRVGDVSSCGAHLWGAERHPGDSRCDRRAEE